MNEEQQTSCCGGTEEKQEEVKTKKCCQTDPEITVCGCKSTKKQAGLKDYVSGIFGNKK